LIWKKIISILKTKFITWSWQLHINLDYSLSFSQCRRLYLSNAIIEFPLNLNWHLDLEKSLHISKLLFKFNSWYFWDLLSVYIYIDFIGFNPSSKNHCSYSGIIIDSNCSRLSHLEESNFDSFLWTELSWDNYAGIEFFNLNLNI